MLLHPEFFWRRSCFLVFLPFIMTLLQTHLVRAQSVNAYARVTLQDDSLLVISNVDETHDTFEADEQVLLIQVQDNTLGSTANSAAFGGLGSIGAAGLFEVMEVDEVRETDGIPDTLILAVNPSIAFSTGSNARLMVVTYPQLGSPHYTTASSLSAPSWNGHTGGVIAFQVENNLYLEHSISADGAGFRAGDHSANQYQPDDCNNTVYRDSDDSFGEKGEGIHFRTNANYRYARGRMLNGGGGGGSHNGGGGGGSNYTAGGLGGAGWNGSSGCNPSTSGIGGIALSGYISPTRVFMGGGGGGGQMNNSAGTGGGNGGGLIFIKADSILTSSTCNLTLSANGDSAANAGNDGAGGGGGGGSIILEVNGYDVSASCPLVIQANGGDGGDVNSGSVHAGGGGGGQGSILFSSPQPTTNVTAHTLNGTGGCDNTGCDSRADDGSGSDDIGILTGMPSLLADYAIGASIASTNEQVRLEWQLTGEPVQCAYKVQRSRDRANWQVVCEGSTMTGWLNSCEDHNQQGEWYYRVVAYPHPGRTVESAHLMHQAQTAEKLLVKMFPNPAVEQIQLRLAQDFIGECRIYGSDGRMLSKRFIVNTQVVDIDVSDLSPGTYQLMLMTPYTRESHRFIKAQD